MERRGFLCRVAGLALAPLLPKLVPYPDDVVTFRGLEILSDDTLDALGGYIQYLRYADQVHNQMPRVGAIITDLSDPSV